MAKEKKETLGTKEAAQKLKVKPSFLRRYLRSKGKGTSSDGEYNRYSWPKDFNFSKMATDIEKYKEANKKTEAKTSKKTKAKKAKKEEDAVEEVA